ncbi:MAG: o-succinylbenzoate--CoA ligase [Planctomycetota bacterium]|jgi:O-succinylbenzoic acid--CoA ligase
MKIARCSAQLYTLPLVRPLTTKVDSSLRRQGVILTLQTDSGLSGYGEIAPLPGLHQETISEAAGQLNKQFDRLLKLDIPENLYPSIRAGIEMALFDLQQQIDQSVDWAGSIPINALCVAYDESLIEQVENLVSQGFSSIKIKVGRESIERDIEMIKQVLDTMPNHVSLRLDANRTWTFTQAKQFCDAIDPEQIEYIEEPTQRYSDHRDLIKAGLPIALDETLSETPLCQLDPEFYRAVVLKPSVLGGFKKTAEIIRWARQHSITPVISSAFQSSLANRLYLLFAASNGMIQTSLGLDTQKWFADDILGNPYRIENGQVCLETLKGRPVLKQALLKPLEDVGLLFAAKAASNTICLCWPAGRSEPLLFPSAHAIPIKKSAMLSKTFVAATFSPHNHIAKKRPVSIPGCLKILYGIHSRLLEDFICCQSDQTGSVTLDQLQLDLSNDASILFTSGSQGNPKGVLHTLDNHYYSAIGASRNIPFSPGDRWLMSLPMYHISGFSLAMRSLIAGGMIVFPKPGQSVADAIVDSHITHLSLVPAQLRQLLKDAAVVNALRQCKSILLGGASTTPDLIQQALNEGLSVHATYGSTEAASQVTTMSAENMKQHPDTSGKTLPHRELKIAPDEEILIKGQTLFKGYVYGNNLDRPLDEEGYFHTGDIGSVDDEGYLAVTGRKDRMFISGGENIHPEEIEKAILKLNLAQKVCVVDIPDAAMGARPVAFINTNSTINSETIKEKLKLHLERFKIPDHFLLWSTLESESLKPEIARFRQIALKQLRNL